MSNTLNINVADSVTSRLPFEPFIKYNNFCAGKLTSVEVIEKSSDDDANWELKGMTYPNLVFNFISFKENKDDKDRFYTLSLRQILYTKSAGDDRTAINIEKDHLKLWGHIKHLYDQYETCANFKPVDIEVNFDMDLSLEDRTIAMRNFFTEVAAIFNKGKDAKKSIYDGADFMLMKLVASGNDNAFLALPDYVGKGIYDTIALKDGKLDTILRFGVNETITLGNTADGATATPSGDSALPPELAKLQG